MTTPLQSTALAAAHARLLPRDGVVEITPGVTVIRRSAVSTVFAHTLHTPAFCLVAQGAKRVYLNDETYEYNAQRFIVYAIDLPLASAVTSASAEAPYMGLRVDIDGARLATLAAMVFPGGIPTAQSQAVQLGHMEPAVVESATRLLDVLARPDDARVFGELYTTELLLRVLRTPVGPLLAQIGVRDSRINKVSAAISYIRDHFTEPLDVAETAERAYMSVSSFHKHFKAATALSPVQYQKVLRLQEARRLLLATDMDAQEVAFTVGYQSVSQFSREYRRQFGAAPKHDTKRLKVKG